MVETSGQAVTVKLQLVDPEGQAVGAPVEWQLGPWEQRQRNVWEVFSSPTTHHRVDVEVV